MKEYMNQDNREYVFEVLQDIIDLDFLVSDDLDARKVVQSVFEYVLRYYASWFERNENEQGLFKYWRIGSVVACQCYTDDAFTLVTVISRLNEALALLEAHKDDLKDSVRFEDDYGGDPNTDKVPVAKVRKLAKLELTQSPQASPSPLASPCSAKEEEDSDVKEEDSDEEKGEVKLEASKEEIKEEKVKADPAESVVEGPALPTRRGRAPVVQPSPSPLAIDLDDSEDEGVKKQEIEIDSEDDSVKGEEISLSDDVKDEEISLSDDSLQDEISLSSGSSDGDGVEVMSDVEDVDDVFPVPPLIESLYKLRVHFVERCLATLFTRRGPLWAKPKIDTFFQDLFYRRSVFAAPQRLQIEAWQSRIKTMQRNGDRDVGEANNPLEAHRPVVDSRETRTIFEGAGGEWAAKQTIDAREVCGGRNVIR
jgi:hypothetical protein